MTAFGRSPDGFAQTVAKKIDSGRREWVVDVDIGSGARGKMKRNAATSRRNSRPVVSIVIATYARRARLERCIAGIRANINVPRETIVVGSGAGDGTESWLENQVDVRFIPERTRQGATRAYNKGFKAAAGDYVLWLNDDAYPLPGAVEAAIRMIERPESDEVGMIAFYHNMGRKRNRLDSVNRDGMTYGIYNVRGVPYANFGLLRRGLLEQVGYLDERYYFCAWDPDLSLKVQREAGLRVVGCREALIHHEELIDARKSEDLKIADEDNAKLFAKWGLPESFSYPDPAPAYLESVRGIIGALDAGDQAVRER
ncbi:MAG: glycosyltransferase family 2 protein [Planctomycetota bacterium]|nr:glycosyltransferase family 2 protein [Planctomycetota bacterium]